MSPDRKWARRQMYLRLLDGLSVELRANKEQGRYLVSSVSLPPGTTVFVEEPVVYAPLSQERAFHCQTCLRLVPSMAATGDSSSARVESSCTECLAHWCSDTCKAKDSFHDKECALVKSVEALAREHSVDVDLVKILMRARQVLQAEDQDPFRVLQDLHPNLQQPIRKAPSVLLANMLSHERHAKPEWVQAVSKAAHDLCALVPGTITPKDLVSLACRVNSNSHGITAPNEPSSTVALGMFPLIALINHSCKPNCIYVGTVLDGRPALQLRTIANVEAGEELCLSYVDLYQSREARQGQLLTSKFFWCNCSRCTQNHPLDNQIGATLADLDHDYQFAYDLVSRPNPPLFLCQQAFRAFLKKYNHGDVMRVHHKLLMANVYLMNCCRALGDLEEAEQACEQVLQKWETLVEAGLIPKYWPERVVFWDCLAELKQIRGASADRELQMAREVRGVCFE